MAGSYAKIYEMDPEVSEDDDEESLNKKVQEMGIPDTDLSFKEKKELAKAARESIPSGCSTDKLNNTDSERSSIKSDSPHSVDRNEVKPKLGSPNTSQVRNKSYSSAASSGNVSQDRTSSQGSPSNEESFLSQESRSLHSSTNSTPASPQSNNKSGTPQKDGGPTKKQTQQQMSQKSQQEQHENSQSVEDCDEVESQNAGANDSACGKEKPSPHSEKNVSSMDGDPNDSPSDIFETLIDDKTEKPISKGMKGSSNEKPNSQFQGSQEALHAPVQEQVKAGPVERKINVPETEKSPYFIDYNKMFNKVRGKPDLDNFELKPAQLSEKTRERLRENMKTTIESLRNDPNYSHFLRYDGVFIPIFGGDEPIDVKRNALSTYCSDLQASFREQLAREPPVIVGTAATATVKPTPRIKRNIDSEIFYGETTETLPRTRARMAATRASGNFSNEDFPQLTMTNRHQTIDKNLRSFGDISSRSYLETNESEYIPSSPAEEGNLDAFDLMNAQEAERQMEAEILSAHSSNNDEIVDDDDSDDKDFEVQKRKRGGGGKNSRKDQSHTRGRGGRGGANKSHGARVRSGSLAPLNQQQQQQQDNKGNWFGKPPVERGGNHTRGRKTRQLHDPTKNKDIGDTSVYDFVPNVVPAEEVSCPICGKNFPTDKIEGHAQYCESFCHGEEIENIFEVDCSILEQCVNCKERFPKEQLEPHRVNCEWISSPPPIKKRKIDS